MAQQSKGQMPPTFTKIIGTLPGLKPGQLTLIFQDETGQERAIFVTNEITSATAAALISRSAISPAQWATPEYRSGRSQPLLTHGFRTLLLGVEQPGIGFLTKNGFEVVLHLEPELLPQLRAEIAKLDAALANQSPKAMQ